MIQDDLYYDQYIYKNELEDISNLEINKNKLINILNSNNYNIYKLYEGVFIKLIYHNNNWDIFLLQLKDNIYSNIFIDIIKKENKIDDFNIQKKSYYDLFTSIIKKIYNNLEDFFKLLDKEYKYIFFIRNSKYNRFVSYLPKNNELYFIFKFIPEYNSYLIEDDIKIPIKRFDCINTPLEYINNINPLKSKGLLLQNKIYKNRFIYIINEKYNRFLKLRDYEPNLIIKYIKLLCNYLLDKNNLITQNNIKEYISFNQDYINIFNKIKIFITKLVNKIYKNYILIKIKKQHITINSYEYYLICKCHEHYLKIVRNKDLKFKINQEIVNKIILSDENIYNLYNFFKNQINI